MTKTPQRAPTPITHPTPHRDVKITVRIPLTGNGLSWTDILIQARGRIDLAISRQLQPSPWTILDGDITYTLTDEEGRDSVLLDGVWRQRNT